MFEMELVIRLLVSVTLGLMIGIERELAHKPAGLRTHALVSLGACLFTIISTSYFLVDPARIASGIVLGVGFIGAGCIMATRGHLQGITTAATLWATAAIGLAVGTRNYLIALVTAILVVLILQLKKIEKSIE
jgi:putative Mg2+ transporter-C (MgtC) family protein